MLLKGNSTSSMLKGRSSKQNRCFEKWKPACSKWSFQQHWMLLLRNCARPHTWNKTCGYFHQQIIATWGWRVQSSGMTKNCNSLIPSEGWIYQEQNTNLKPPSEEKKKKKKCTKPRVYVLVCISKQITDKCWTKFRYNLQFIKCTVCIVQDKVVKVVWASGPVRLWDFGLGSLFGNGPVSYCTRTLTL